MELLQVTIGVYETPFHEIVSSCDCPLNAINLQTFDLIEAILNKFA